MSQTSERGQPGATRSSPAPVTATTPAGAPAAGAPATGAPAAGAALAHGVEHVTDAAGKILRDLVGEQRRRAVAFDPACADLWQDLDAVTGGKLLRPRLVAAAYLGLGGTDLVAAAHVAAAHELLHTAMVVHDDVLDHDEVRRGHPNVAGRTRARLTADGVPRAAVDQQAGAAALLAGDAALAQAFGLLATGAVPPARLGELVRLLADGVATTVSGELLDVRGALAVPSDVDAVLVAELKTAVYSFRVPLESGAVLADAPGVARAVLAGVGTALGVAYQLVDDELGTIGDPALTGKSVLSDLREGKRTELLRVAWQRADPRQAALLDTHVGRADLDDSGAHAVVDVLHDTGAVEDVRALARRSADIARTLATHLPEPLATYLAGVVDDLAGRAR
ncbi:polyprenyl synthetase family protein [Cellulomonas dongxiuzhuiae]|uniref:polyprenyl synthetase family protein n=1 Tax=Cellulomonas dongxiuzhuiae TaxID=2819979 RepID=UPI001AAE786D|nr:polyprenyl synthetase family protein [Cellulomonas dongxiuzhuiae]MBO3088201.1 polyprenyl synthetase family protein [Cellulomonas dongxiuzhuiae]